MPLTRRALMLSTAAAGLAGFAGLAALPAFAARVQGRMPLPAGIWRSRTTADLFAVGERACRTYTLYGDAATLADETDLSDVEGQVLETRLDDEGHLEVEYWGTVTRFQYERLDGWPAVPRLEDDDWIFDPNRTVAAFFDILSGHFAFAAERGIDWGALRADCEAAFRRGPANQAHLFDTLAETLRTLEDGHGSLKGLERYEDSRPWEGQFYGAWKAAGGRAVDGDYSDGFTRSWLDHVRRSILSASGHVAARDTVAWGRLSDGLGYISLMACEGLSDTEGGHADVLAARRIFDRVIRDLADARGLIVDLRCNPGGWDRVALTLASHLTDRTVRAFTKQPVRHGSGLQVQTIEVAPAQGARFTGPVAVLTSDSTVSAAEVGALALRALPNTRSFGRSTYGALSDPYRYRLPNGWKGTLSNEIYRSWDGAVYEGSGIPPDQPSAEPSARDFWGSIDAQTTDAKTWLLAL